MARQPEHPLHSTMVAWAEWVRAGSHDNQGWPGVSATAPERFLAETDEVGLARARRSYRIWGPAEDERDYLKIPAPVQATPTQPRTARAKLPRLNPGPHVEWRRISRIVRRLECYRDCRRPASAVQRYYVLGQGNFDADCARGCDIVMGALAAWDLSDY